MRYFSVCFFLFFLAACAPVRQVTLTDDELKTILKRHVSTLASDEYEGREPGTKGEELALDYIANRFKDIGLKPMGEKKYVQEFSFPEGATIETGTQLYINAKSFKVDEDFYPLQFSGNGVAIGYIAKVGYGIDAARLLYDDFI